MDRYQASVLNEITKRGGPGWTILALMIMHRWSIATAIGGPVSALIATKALGVW
ncbi:hypothetical protein [Novosphingobium sp. MBES04]|uniref:hypothetical protein n=1 Tax=Novosphingobium sp. MBES04 TaxID=1206458 RepID=UPI00131F1ED8|nr:hypothetical protein [Novosphingobium sp. MBES04]